MKFINHKNAIILFLLLMGYLPIKAQTIVANEIEYWLDDLQSPSSKIAIVGSTTDIQKNIELGNLPVGLHTLFYRIKDNVDNYSSIYKSTFFKQPTGDIINEIEYWFDNNYVSKKVLDTNSNSIESDIETAELPFGLHIVSLRAKTSSNSLSEVISYPFLKIGKSDTNEKSSLIEGYRYWLNDDLSKIHSVALENKVATANITLNIPIPSRGRQDISIQLYDNRGYWSQVIKSSFDANYTTGISEEAIDDIHVYFKNNNDNLIIENVTDNLFIYSANGNLIYKKTKTESYESINTSNWSNGIYIITASGYNSVNKTFRIVK